MTELRPDVEVGGYRIEALAGRGGMGLVYRARQRRPDRIVALKVISAAAASDAEFRERFERESAIAAAIEHPNVIPVYEVGEDGGLLYIAMRFVEGVDLGGLLAEQGRLEPGRAMRLIAQVADALDAAHARGLVHRDVKPGNVLVAASDHVYLTDFGIAKLIADAAGLTKTGALVGTPDYIAPEQIEGSRVDARTDVYALGCVTFQLLSGRVPFPRESAVATIFAHLNDPPPRLSEVSGPLADAVQRAMAKRPEDRFFSAGDFARAVTTTVAGHGSASERAGDAGDPTIASAPIHADRVRFEHFGKPLTVLINYRPDDTPGAARFLYERLHQRFGGDSVLIDVILEPWMERLGDLRSAGNRGGAFLVVIGPRWASALRGRAAQELGKPSDDIVRRDIEWALREWPGAVIPVTIGSALPDPATLPRSIRGLCRRPVAELRETSLDRDLSNLIGRLEGIARGSPEASESIGASLDAASDRATPPSAAKIRRTASGVPAVHDDHYADVIEGFLDGTVVPVLGSRLRGELPDGDHLAEHIAQTFSVERNSQDLAEIAQYVAVTRGERRLYAVMKDVLAGEPTPSAVHRFLAALPRFLRHQTQHPRPQMIISAGYDRALERAFEEANEPFDYAVFMASGGWFVHFPWGEQYAEPIAATITEPQKYAAFPIEDTGELARTVIVKIHGTTDGQEGTFRWMNNYVVTEDQYIDYLPTDNIHKLVPVQILDKLKSSRCLFLGYPLRDWHARVFLRRIWQGESITEKSWAIEDDPDVLEKDSWGLVGHVELLAASLPEYVDELRARLLATAGLPA